VAADRPTSRRQSPPGQATYHHRSKVGGQPRTGLTVLSGFPRVRSLQFTDLQGRSGAGENFRRHGRVRRAADLCGCDERKETCFRRAPSSCHCRSASPRTTAAVARVSPTASREIGPALSRNSRADDRWVAAKSSGGRTTGRIRSGFNDSADTPKMSGTASPKMVSRIGNGTPIRGAEGVSATTPASRIGDSRTVDAGRA